MSDETVTFDEDALSKGQLRKLNALRKTLGDDDIAREAFAKWLEKYGASAGDKHAAALAVMVLRAIQSEGLQLPRGGYIVRRGRGRVIVEPAETGERRPELSPPAGPRIERPAGMSPRERGWRNRIDAIPEAGRTEAAILTALGRDSVEGLSETQKRIFDHYTMGDKLKSPETVPYAPDTPEGGGDGPEAPEAARDTRESGRLFAADGEEART